MRVPFNDLTWQWRHIEDSARSDFDQVFASSQFSSGRFVEAFERQIAEWLGVPHAIGVNSGTSALHLALLAAGIRSGDEVLVPAHTFIGSAWGILYIGAIPVFCDVDEETGTIDIEIARRLVTPRTRAVVPVHLYGQPANMDAVLSFPALPKGDRRRGAIYGGDLEWTFNWLARGFGLRKLLSG